MQPILLHFDSIQQKTKTKYVNYDDQSLKSRNPGGSQVPEQQRRFNGVYMVSVFSGLVVLSSLKMRFTTFLRRDKNL